ncbi:MAG: HU family DNA-binding protein [bacterium]
MFGRHTHFLIYFRFWLIKLHQLYKIKALSVRRAYAVIEFIFNSLRRLSFKPGLSNSKKERNPKTGDEIKIPVRHYAKFKAGCDRLFL